MSIAQVPMTWNPGDVWSVEVRPECLLLRACSPSGKQQDVIRARVHVQVDLQPGERVQYKYVILEEQVSQAL